MVYGLICGIAGLFHAGYVGCMACLWRFLSSGMGFCHTDWCPYAQITLRLQGSLFLHLKLAVGPGRKEAVGEGVDS
jgi:hypothetical protein